MTGTELNPTMEKFMHTYSPSFGSSAPVHRAATATRRVATATLTAVALLVSLVVLAPVADAAPDSVGTEYWVVFQHNQEAGTPTQTIFVSGGTATTGTVAIPGTGFTQDFAVTPGNVTTVVLPSGSNILTSDGTENIGVRITAADEVSVYGLNRQTASTDAFLAYPVDILGTDHLVMAYENVSVVNRSHFAVVAPTDNTTVTITPAMDTGVRPGGVPFEIVLDQGEAYQLANLSTVGDVTGTRVVSDKPVAVFGGHSCANIPAGQAFCDHLVQQLPPTETWGRSFVTLPLATRLGGDTFRILASQPGTEVSLNGAIVATLDAGEFHEQLIAGSATIATNEPVLVAQFSNSTSFDSVTSDPFMMLIPPTEQFLASYTVTTPASGFGTNFINIVAPDSAVGSVLLDGVAVPPGDFTPIGSSGFSGAQVPVALGAHTLSGPAAFGAFIYGFDVADSYGYAGGLSLSPVARATDLDLAVVPPLVSHSVGNEVCIDATVTDQDSLPLNGIRVDFVVTGENPTNGFASTAENGVARFCYTGEQAGSDNVAANVGTVVAGTEILWGLECNPFTDVDLSNPFCFDIEWMALNGYATGWPDGTYRPGVDVSRQAKAAFIWRLNGSPTPEPGFPTFSDVTPDNAFYDAIAWMAQEGIADGYDDGTYRPAVNISRQAVAAFLWRLAGSPVAEPGFPTFSDVPESNPFYDAIAWMAQEGITEGYDDGTYRPDHPTTRQAMAAFIRRYVSVMEATDMVEATA